MNPTELVAHMAKQLPSQNDSSLLATQLLQNIHIKADTNKKARAEREQRRRKVLVDNVKAQAASEAKRREELFMSKVMRQCDDERKAGEQLWRIRQYKNIVADNVRFRDQQLRERRKMRMQEALKRDESLFDSAQRSHEVYIIPLMNPNNPIGVIPSHPYTPSVIEDSPDNPADPA